MKNSVTGRVEAMWCSCGGAAAMLALPEWVCAVIQ